MGIAATATFAEEEKFSVEGDTLYYNTEKPGLNRSFVSLSDAAHFRSLLNMHPEVTRIDSFLRW